jgi:hypothetical protein
MRSIDGRKPDKSLKKLTLMDSGVIRTEVVKGRRGAGKTQLIAACLKPSKLLDCESCKISTMGIGGLLRPPLRQQT